MAVLLCSFKDAGLERFRFKLYYNSITWKQASVWSGPHYMAVIIKRNSTARKYKHHYEGQRLFIWMVHGMSLKNVSGRSYKVTIRTFGSSLVLYAWMNGYSTLLHNIAPGKYIVIKVECGLQFSSKYFLRNQIEKNNNKIIIKMLMVLDFKILSLWFLIECWRYNTLTRENNWFLNVLVRSNFATPTPFGSVSCFVLGVDLSNYNLNSVLIHKASYSKGYQSYLMHRGVLESIWKIGRYPIKVSEVLS